MSGQRPLLSIIVFCCSLAQLGCENVPNAQVRKASVSPPTQHPLSVSPQEQVLQYLAGAAQRLLVDTGESERVVYMHQNHLDSTTLLSDATGEWIGRWAYSPYGTFRDATGQHPIYGFSNQEHDLSTGLVYFKYRYLDPTNGRWLQVDPLYGLSTSKKMEKYGEATTAYAYVGNQAINQFDPNGLEAKPAAKGQKAKPNKQKGKAGKKPGAKAKQKSKPGSALSKLKSVTKREIIAPRREMRKMLESLPPGAERPTALGRLRQTLVMEPAFKGLESVSPRVLNTANWSPQVNADFVAGAPGAYILVSPTSNENLHHAKGSESYSKGHKDTIFKGELKQIGASTKAGAYKAFSFIPNQSQKTKMD